jgi:hypothetical protein
MLIALLDGEGADVVDAAGGSLQRGPYWAVGDWREPYVGVLATALLARGVITRRPPAFCGTHPFHDHIDVSGVQALLTSMW